MGKVDCTCTSNSASCYCCFYPIQMSVNSPVRVFLKSKMKKIQEKYGDQDTEERQLRLQLLAVNKSLTSTDVSALNQPHS